MTTATQVTAAEVHGALLGWPTLSGGRFACVAVAVLGVAGLVILAIWATRSEDAVPPSPPSQVEVDERAHQEAAADFARWERELRSPVRRVDDGEPQP